MKKELIIDLNRIRKALPDRAKVVLIKYKKTQPAIEIFISEPSLSEKDFEECKEWQREIIGVENISEHYTEETGRHWYIMLKRQVMKFEGVSDEDINSFIDTKLVKDGKLIKPKTP